MKLFLKRLAHWLRGLWVLVLPILIEVTIRLLLDVLIEPKPA